MWNVAKTPSNYFPRDKEEWCIIDDDGDIEDFYKTQEQAENAFAELKGKSPSFWSSNRAVCSPESPNSDC